MAAFGEEEGSRFPTHLPTSSALIGAVRQDLLDSRDRDGISVREALAAAGGDADAYPGCARQPGEIAAYLELNIEQGPVLDQRGLAMAAVTGINGSLPRGATVPPGPLQAKLLKTVALRVENTSFNRPG